MNPKILSETKAQIIQYTFSFKSIVRYKIY